MEHKPGAAGSFDNMIRGQNTILQAASNRHPGARHPYSALICHLVDVLRGPTTDDCIAGILIPAIASESYDHAEPPTPTNPHGFWYPTGEKCPVCWTSNFTGDHDGEPNGRAS